MDWIAINLGWAVCTTLLMVPPEVCLDAAHNRVIGAAVMMVTSLCVSVPATLKAARALSRRPDPPGPLSRRRPYQPLPPMQGPAKRTLAQ